MTKTYPTIIDQFCKFEQEKPNDLLFAEPVKGVYKEFSWQLAGQEIRSMAAYLQNCGLNKGDKVAILSKNCAHWILADLAIAMAGMVSVPIYPNITPAGIHEIILHCEAKAIFIGKLDKPLELRKGVPDELLQISFPFYFNEGCLNWDDLVANTPPLVGTPTINPQDVYCIMYTSGTTGNPKGVMHSFHGISFALFTFLSSNPPFENEIFFSYLPLCHVAEKMLVKCGALFTGATIYFVESMDTFAANLQHTQPTVFLAVPRIWEKTKEEILKKMPQKKLSFLLRVPIISTLIKKAIQKKLGLSRAKYIYSGASPINLSLLQWFAKLGIIIQEGYGMTENAALSHINRKGATKFGTVGKNYPGVEVKFTANNELLVKSEASMIGYYKEPELTKEMFEDGWLKTGDEASIDEEGYVTITGRLKDQFKTSKGKYVIPAPIELKVLSNPLISQACIVGSGMPAPLILCTLSEKARVEEEVFILDQLTHFLATINHQLEHHEKLAKLIIVKDEWTIENGVLTPTLKIKRKIIDELFQQYYMKWLNLQPAVSFV